uniref:Cyclin-like domain-containing protein n=1 Tax=Leptocylindrus danicus TaxID=163516 RepID=A0A7S2K5A1_9STRA|mmetsp:Transcript_18042/g.26828  ORF Transcript_18042/g.26828 Transcript_18042/m.26828 type:complete len:366 (+) Transcript_18042:389-1486(+)
MMSSDGFSDRSISKKELRPFGGNLYADFCFLRDNTNAGYFDVDVLLEAELQYQPVEFDYITDVQKDGFSRKWRSFIAKWLYKLADYVQINREVVSVTMSIVDRYLAFVSVNARTFKLVSLSSFHIASKILLKKHLPMAWLIERSKSDNFSMGELSMKEQQILSCITYKLHPPTNEGFVRLFLGNMNFIDDGLEEILYHAIYLVELSVCDYDLVGVIPSVIATAAILKSVDDIQPVLLSRRQKQKIKSRLKRGARVKSEGFIQVCIERLDILYQRSQKEAAASDKIISVPNSPSPTSVASDLVGRSLFSDEAALSGEASTSKKSGNYDRSSNQVSKVASTSKSGRRNCNSPAISSRSKNVSKRKKH